MTIAEQFKADVQALFEAGLTAMAIADALGESVSRVRNLIANAGMRRGGSARGRPVGAGSAEGDLADQTDRADALLAIAMKRTSTGCFADGDVRTRCTGRLNFVPQGASALAYASSAATAAEGGE